jgi:hypothetical protein
MQSSRWVVLYALIGIAFWGAVAEPLPGDVFRDYDYTERFAANSAASAFDSPQECTRVVEGVDLQGAVRAELAVQLWGGHEGTFKYVQINGADSIDILPAHGSTWHHYQQHFGRPTIDIPLSQLKGGANAVTFFYDTLRSSGFGKRWPNFWIYAFTLRVFYEPSKPHPTGQIVWPLSGARIGDSPVIRARVENNAGGEVVVDFVGHYLDYDNNGDGVLSQWQYGLTRGSYGMHMGTGTNAAGEYVKQWKNQWIPDQQGIRIAAIVTADDGMSFFTPSVDSLILEHKGYSVALLPCAPLGRKFGVRTNDTLRCTITASATISSISEVQLVLATWSADYPDEPGATVALNGKVVASDFGLAHGYSLDRFSVAPQDVLSGVNEFSICSATREHAAEVLWPGPALLLKSEKALFTQSGREQCAQEPGAYRAVVVDLYKTNQSGAAQVMFDLSGRCFLPAAGTALAPRIWVQKLRP